MCFSFIKLLSKIPNIGKYQKGIFIFRVFQKNCHQRKRLCAGVEFEIRQPVTEAKLLFAVQIYCLVQ